MAQNVKKTLKKAAGARTDVGCLFDNMCPTDIYLLSFTYHILATIGNGEYIPKVTLKLLNTVYTLNVNNGPGNCTTFVGDQI